MIRKNLFARLYRNPEPGDDGAVEAEGTGNDARVALLNSIGDANDQVRAEELAEVNDDGSTSEFQLDATAQAEIERAEQEANQTAPVDDAPAETSDAAPKTYKLKVNGKELELTEAQVLERAQKVEAADTYLNEARRIKQEAQTNHAQPPANTTPDVGMSPEERRALVRAIQMGTEEEADTALEKLLQPRQPALNAEVLARTVDERLTFKDAIDRFKSEYQDVMSDPVLASWAQKMDTDMLAQGDKRSYWDRYQSIGEEIRGWLKAKTGTPEGKSADTKPAATESKQQRKAQAPAVPKAANSRAPAATADDEGEESASEVIANIAKARGGPQWMRG